MLPYQTLMDKFSSIKYKQNQNMADYTTMQVGGKVELMFFPKFSQEIVELLSYLQANNIPYFILGKGSNLIVNDEGVDLIIINTEEFNQITIDKTDSTLIHAESGASLEDISLKALEYGLTGLEFMSGIPGTLGGAVFMNAGAYGGEIKDVLEQSTILTNKIEILDNKSHEFSYRSSSISSKKAMILSSTFRLKKGDVNQIKSEMKNLSEQRTSKQPLELPSAGSVFKRPEGFFAGKLITDAGLKGFKLGGAMVSDKHAGFIVNNNKAKAQDILDLISHIQDTVKTKLNVHLEPEVKFLERDGTFRKFQ